MSRVRIKTKHLETLHDVLTGNQARGAGASYGVSRLRDRKKEAAYTSWAKAKNPFKRYVELLTGSREKKLLAYSANQGRRSKKIVALMDPSRLRPTPRQQRNIEAAVAQLPPEADPEKHRGVLEAAVLYNRVEKSNSRRFVAANRNLKELMDEHKAIGRARNFTGAGVTAAGLGGVHYGLGALRKKKRQQLRTKRAMDPITSFTERLLEGA